MTFNQSLQESLKPGETLLTEAAFSNIVNLLKKIEKEDRKGFKKVKYFDDQQLKRFFKDVGYVHNISVNQLDKRLSAQGFSDQQIKQLKPYFEKKIKSTEQQQAQSKEYVQKHAQSLDKLRTKPKTGQVFST